MFNHTGIGQGGSTLHLIQSQREKDSGWIGCIVVAVRIVVWCGVVRSLMVQHQSLRSCRVDSKWYVVFDQIGIFFLFDVTKWPKK